MHPACRHTFSMTKPSHDEPDGMLVAAALAGDQAAFAEIVKRYQGPLLHAARSRLPQRELAEDAVQEAFLCALKWLETYDSRFSFRTWLWTILLNQCTRIGQREARRERCAPERADASAAKTPASSAIATLGERISLEASPVEALLHRERADQLHALLAKLPDVQADALRLRFFGGLKFQEIADAMGISESGAKNRVKLALVQLAAWLQAEQCSAGDTMLGDQR